MSLTDSQAIIADAVERAGMYGLLSRLWIAEPDQALIDGLESPSVRSALPDWYDPTTKSMDELVGDFTQLFIGPKDQLPPYQSVWQHGQFEAAPAGTMRTYFEVVGYETTRFNSAEMMPDHIAIQFDLMSHLLREAASMPKLVSEMEDLLASFFDDCLSWCTPLISAVGGRCMTKFYASVARLTGEFLTDEAKRFGHTG